MIHNFMNFQIVTLGYSLNLLVLDKYFDLIYKRLKKVISSLLSIKQSETNQSH